VKARVVLVLVLSRAVWTGRDEGGGDGDVHTNVGVQTMNGAEESAARLFQDETKTICRNLLQRSPAGLAEAFKPSSTMPSMSQIMFCSAALRSGETEPLQSIGNVGRQLSLCRNIQDRVQMLSRSKQHVSTSGTCAGLRV
jgi:hypothetical protein